MRSTLLAACLVMSGVCWVTRAVGQEPEADAAAKVTYDDHVRPILREHCFSCHNQNEAKGGLALDLFNRALEGGSSGEVVVEQDLESSRLWSLVSHEEEPFMPPGQDKLPDVKLAVIRQWIEGGLLENAGSSAKAKKQTLQLAAPSETGRPAGPVAMPEGLSRAPVLYTPRAAAVSALATSPWAPLVAVAGQQQIVLYHSDTAQLLGILPFPEGVPYSLRFSRDGALLLGAGGRGASVGLAALYDVKSGNRVLTVGDELDVVLTADISPDLTRIALGGPGKVVRIYATESGELLHEIKKHTDWIYAVRFSPDGVLLATADRSNGLVVWEADTAREYLDLRGHTDAVTDVAWRSDANVLASGSTDGTIRLWEMNEGKEIARASAHGGGVNAVAYALDGRIASVGQDRVAKLWDAGLQPLKTFPEFPEPALRVTFTHDGKRIVAGDWSGQVSMWNAEDAQPIAHLPPNPPTLEMQILEYRQQLAAAQSASEQAVADLKAAQEKAGAVSTQTAATLQEMDRQLAQLREAAAKCRTDLDATVAQVDAAAAEMQAATQAVEEAQRALEAATANLQLAKAKLAETSQRKDVLAAALPVAEDAARQAAISTEAAKTQLAQQQQVAAEAVPSQEAAVAMAQARVVHLATLIQQLEAEKVASTPAPN
ncbi:MAG: c-type cytochrome domain-containing protein [Pirellulaceae bacterium]